MLTSGKYSLLFALLAALLMLALGQTPLVQSFENLTFDARARMVAKTVKPSNEIVVVGIDDSSLQQLNPDLGRWPWPRAVHGTIIDYCSESDAMILDILFPEDAWSGFDQDQKLVAAAIEANNLIGSFHFEQIPSSEEMLELLEPSTLGGNPNQLKEEVNRNGQSELGNPIPPFRDLATAYAVIGHTHYTPDRDALLRDYHLAIRKGEILYPSLALAGYAVSHGLDMSSITLDAEHRILLGDHKMPIGESGRIRIIQHNDNYTFYSAKDIIESFQLESAGKKPRIPRSAFKDKIVLYGLTALSMPRDRKPTPNDPRSPGVLIHAEALDNLIQAHSFTFLPEPWVIALTLLMAFAPLLFNWERPWDMYRTGFMIVILYGTITIVTAIYLHHILPAIMPSLALIISCTLWGTSHWYVELSHRRRLEATEAAKQRFTDMLVHDLKNTLAPVVLSVDYARGMRSDDLEFFDEFTNTVDESTRKLLTQIGNLLDIRRMNEGKLPLNRDQVSMEDFLHGVCAPFRTSALKYNQKINLLCDREQARPVALDINIISRVVENLLWNACKYGKPEQPIYVGCRFKEASCEVFIQNHGNVLDEKIKETLFAEFTTGPGADSTRLASTGLGLSFCKLAIEAHDGTISLKSPCFETNDGVEVIFELPISSENGTILA